MQQSFLCPRCNNVAFLGQRYCGFCDLAFLYSCNSCGSALIPEAVYCGNCGTQIDWGEPVRQEIQTVLSQVPAPATAPEHVELPVNIGQSGTLQQVIKPMPETRHVEIQTENYPFTPSTAASDMQASVSKDISISKTTGCPTEAPPTVAEPDSFVASSPDERVSVEHKAKATEHHEKSLLLLKEGHFSLAIDELTYAIKYDPTRAIVFMLRGQTYYKKGDLELALADLNYAIELDPNLSDAFYYRGSVYYYMQNFDCAIDDFSKAVAVDDTDAAAYHNRGCALMMKGKFYEAIDDINRSINFDPKDPRVFCSRGSAYAQTGQTEKAAADYRQVKNMTTDPAIIHKAEQALRDLGEG